jgi:hypothetical protein
MNPDFIPVPNDSIRVVKLLLYASATPLQIIQGTATGALDLSPYVIKMTQKPRQLDFTLSWHSELFGLLPLPGNLVVVNLGTQLLWTGVAEEVANYQSERGTRELAITARTRDGNALWRTSPRVSGIYPEGTQLTFIAQQLCSAIGLAPAEMALPAVSAYTVHSNTQMANLSIWDMLTTLYQSVGYQPYVDGYGKIKCISRDTQRTADLTITSDRVIAITGSYSKRQKTAVRIKWLDPNLTQVIQPAQSLATASLTAGFFQPTVEKDVAFSTDGTQAALNTYLVIKQSCNSGLLPVATEGYVQLTPTLGHITLTNTYFTLIFLVVDLAGILAASYIPDEVAFGFTIPIGRIVQGLLLFAAMLVMSSIGTGSYEIWGQPYSWVHQMNTTEAYDFTAPAWQEAITEIENDFVMSEAMSEAFATRELLYEVQSAVSYGAQIVDDPRIEVGDILALPDGSQIYVTDYERDLTRGAAAILGITGFQAGATGTVIAGGGKHQVNVMGAATTAQGQSAGVPLSAPGTLSFTSITTTSAQVNYAAATGGAVGYEYEVS